MPDTPTPRYLTEPSRSRLSESTGGGTWFPPNVLDGGAIVSCLLALGSGYYTGSHGLPCTWSTGLRMMDLSIAYVLPRCAGSGEYVARITLN
jgi:hypothetical protein